MATKSVRSALIMSIAISCLASFFSASMPASATVHTSQLNVNGIHEGALRYAAEPNNLHPRAITGNEVCGSKGQSAPSPLDRLQFALAYNGYAYALWPQNSDSVLCGGAPTYNIVGLLGDVVNTGVYIFPGQAPGDSSPQRNAVCVRTQFIFINISHAVRRWPLEAPTTTTPTSKQRIFDSITCNHGSTLLN